MAGQGLSGDCVDASNFTTTDQPGGFLGLGAQQANDFSRDAVGSTVTDAAASSFAATTNQTRGDEQVSRIDVAADTTGAQSATVSPVATSESSGARASIPPSEVAGAEAIVHTHPTNGTEITPGNEDWQAPARGLPNYIAHGERSVVVEISGGQVRVRVVSGSVSRSERSQIQDQANRFQRQGVSR